MSMTRQRSALYRALSLFQPCGISPLVVGLACLLVPAPLLAAELLVPETYKTIQAALDAAVSGDVVSVAPRRASPRVYQENVRFMSDGVTLRSRTRHGTTIQGDGTNHVVTLNPYSGTVEGFVITGSGQNHSGVFTSQAQQVIRHNLITGNDHGISISSGSVALIEANHIVDNGPLYLTSGIRVVSASATIVNNLIARSGVGIWVGSHSPGVDIVNNTLVDNTNYGMIFGLGAGISEIWNNIVTGSEYGIYASGEYALNRSGYVGQFLLIDNNLLWANSVWDYYAVLGSYTPDGFDFEPFNSGPFDPLPGSSEVYADPLLDPVTGYELLADSPAIDAGDNAICPGTDIDGYLRPYDGNDPLDGFADCDIGVIEYLPEPHRAATLAVGTAFLALLYRWRVRDQRRASRC